MQKSQIIAALVSAIQTQDQTGLVYVDKDGVVSIRLVVVKSIERAANGGTIVRVFDLRRNAPRTFCLNGIQQAERGATHAAVQLGNLA